MKNLSFLSIFFGLLLFLTGCTVKEQPTPSGMNSLSGSTIISKEQIQTGKKDTAENAKITEDIKIKNLEEENAKMKEELEKYKEILIQEQGKSSEKTEDFVYENLETPENTSIEKWREKLNQSTGAEIKKFFEKDGLTYFSLDFLTRNPNFKPGLTNYWINENKKTRDFFVNKETKAYLCGEGFDDNVTTADVKTPVLPLIEKTKKAMKESTVIYFFETENDRIKNIFEQCLP